MDVRALPSCSSPLSVLPHPVSIASFLPPIPTLEAEKMELYQVRDHLTLTTWANPVRNNHLLLRSSHFLRSALPGHCESVHFYQTQRRRFRVFFSSSKKYCKGQCTAAAVGQALKDHTSVYILQHLHMRVLAGQT
jgi:hypothetical protein